MISAVEFKYDRHLTDVILDTIESNLVDELEYWLSSEFAGGQLDIGDQEELKGAVRASLRKTHEAHLGIHHGAIESLTAGHSYLNDFSRKINQINI
ncbi:hypothetical protein IMAU30094_00001 [Lactobacillus helveticus]|nr:hypothetical protein [Lactobacillus helveticus]